ncbi:MAG: hypothetical protein OXU23_00715 [Candidatus Poribacteria bacterium]|nr:hypothetical protein [Candidatus Poribacteria bacterium]
MKRCLFLLTTWLFLNVSLIGYAQSPQHPIKIGYLIPSDVSKPTQKDTGFLLEAIRNVQTFYLSEMKRHGFKEKTFKLDPEIKIVEGKLKMTDYNTFRRIQSEFENIEFGLNNEIYIVFIKGASTINNGNAFTQLLCSNIPSQFRFCNSMIGIPAQQPLILEVLIAHEIGHSLGLNHAKNRLIDNLVDIMYFPLIVVKDIKEELRNYAISYENADFLDENNKLSSIESQENPKALKINADVNFDGKTDLEDVKTIRQAMNGNETGYNTDVNGDDITDENDLALVKTAAIAAIIAASPSKQKIKITTWGSLKIKK